MLQQYETIGEIFFRFRAKLHWKKQVLLCSANAWIGTHATFPVIPKQCCCFLVVQSFPFEFTTHLTGQTFVINWSKIQLSWVLMLYYLYKMMFSVYKSVIVTPCACNLFVRKVMKITRYMDVCFWRSFFSAFFNVWWLYLEINHSVVAEIICTIYSFIHARTQHNISNKNSFQKCYIFIWIACAPFGTKSYIFVISNICC